MNRSSDAYGGSVWSHSKVTTREDGQVEVSFPNNPEVPPGVASNVSTAIEKAKQNFRELDSKGTLNTK